MNSNVEDFVLFFKSGYLTMDRNGTWVWWEKEPTCELTNDIWIKPHADNSKWMQLSNITPVEDWRKSLIKIGEVEDEPQS